MYLSTDTIHSEHFSLWRTDCNLNRLKSWHICHAINQNSLAFAIDICLAEVLQLNLATGILVLYWCHVPDVIQNSAIISIHITDLQDKILNQYKCIKVRSISNATKIRSLQFFMPKWLWFLFSTVATLLLGAKTRVATLIVATIYLQLIQNRYMFRSFTVLQCSHQHCVQPVASDVEVVGYL